MGASAARVAELAGSDRRLQYPWRFLRKLTAPQGTDSPSGEWGVVQQLITCQCDITKLGKMVVLTSIHIYMENHTLSGGGLPG